MTSIASLDDRLAATDGKLVGYCGVSTDDQDCTIQITTLERLGCKKIYADKVSSRCRDRAQLAACLDYLRERDVLAITRVDRLGRSLADLIKIADDLRRRDVSLYLALQNIDTGTPMGQMFYPMLGVTRRLRAEGLRPVDIARQLKIGRTSVYKYLDGIHLAVDRPPPELTRTG